MKSFILDRHTDPSNPTMKGTQDDKIPIYDSKADAEADLTNIEEGAIVATKDTGATEKVVDVVQDGNMNPVTSNAVAKLTGPISDISTLVSGNVINIGVIRSTCGTGLYALKCETSTTIFTVYLAIWSVNWSLDYVFGTASHQEASTTSTVTVTPAVNITNIVKLG